MTFIKLIKGPALHIEKGRGALSRIEILAADEGYWKLIRKQAGNKIANEKDFWKTYHKDWAEAAKLYEAKLTALEAKMDKAVGPSTTGDEGIILLEETAAEAKVLEAEMKLLEDKIKRGESDDLMQAVNANIQIGSTGNGPGMWLHRQTPVKGASYQRTCTGAPPNVEYVVKTNLMKSGEKKFDGFNSTRNSAIDAKDWDKWPPIGQDWATQKVLMEARKDLSIAKSVGINLEYHVPTISKKIQLDNLFMENGIGIKVVVTPK